MTARLTPAEARKLGITVPKTTSTRTTRKEGKGPYHTRCTTCGTEFTSMASESRHLHITHHIRFEVVL